MQIAKNKTKEKKKKKKKKKKTLIHIINPVDKTMILLYTPPTQHHSFFRNLPPASTSVAFNT